MKSLFKSWRNERPTDKEPLVNSDQIEDTFKADMGAGIDAFRDRMAELTWINPPNALTQTSRKLKNQGEKKRQQLWDWLAQYPEIEFDSEPSLGIFFFYSQNREMMLHRVDEYLKEYPERSLDGHALSLLVQSEFLKAELEYINLNGDFITGEIDKWEKANGRCLSDEETDAIYESLFLASLEEKA